MLTYPTIDPIALQLGPLKVHWYGLMYLFAFAAAWLLGRYRAKHANGVWQKDEVDDLIFYTAVGAVIGGRIGYMLFYDFGTLITQPLQLFAIWRGGMSFHGGMLGVFAAFIIFAYRFKKPIFTVTDFFAPLVPLGLGFGRIGNFLNGELWGRVTDVPWGMVFPHVDALVRHPSQLYQCFGEGVLLFTVLWLYSAKLRPPMAVSGVFLVGYGVIRFTLEFFRQPDPQLGFVVFEWLTMGQLLSVPMVVAGVWMLVLAYRGRLSNATIS